MAKNAMNAEEVYLRLLEDVEGGYYPLRRLRNLNVEELAHFVTLLVKFTPKALGASSANVLPLYGWFNDFSLQRNLTSIKNEWRYNLKKIILDCCQLFRNSKEKCLLPIHRLLSDQECGIKMISNKPECSPAIKKQKILSISLNRNDITSESYRNQNKFEEKISSQLDFMSYLQLDSIANPNESTSQIAQQHNLKSLRKKCNKRIPFSSNIGQIILKAENNHISDEYVEKKMNRIDRFLNEPIKYTKKKYSVSYVEPGKPQHVHVYKFPKRQYHQLLSNRSYSEFCHSICKPLKVTIRTSDIEEQHKNCAKENTMPSKRTKRTNKKVANASVKKQPKKTSKVVDKRKAKAALLSSICTPLKIKIKNENLVEFKKRRDHCKTDGKEITIVCTKL